MIHRQIRKFKVWDKSLEKFIPFDTLLGVDFESPLYEFLQFTCLTDSKGKEICEGDIIQRKNQWDLELKAIVTYQPPGFVAKLNGSDYNLFNFNNIQVMGNIFENPELFDEK